MNRLTFGPLLILAFVAAPVRAEKPLTNNLGLSSAASMGDVKATPEMWFYDQAMRQYKDPQQMVRIKADQRAQCRERRIESMKWFGFSNTRPRACSDPFHGDYSPGWVSSPGYFPSRWNGVSQP